MRLTESMRNVLAAASKQPLRRVFNPDKPGKPAWPAHPSTLAALIRRGYLERGEIRNRNGWPTVLWTVTKDGIEALTPETTVRVQRPFYIAEGWPDYTSDSGRKMRGEPEAVRPSEISGIWGGASLERHAAQRDRREAARRLARNTKAA